MKDNALWLYQRITAANRRRLLTSWRQEGRVPIAILFYHRVADSNPNPWTISREEFSAHLDWIEQNYDVVSLEEAQRRIQSDTNVRPTVSITFDDGYAENADFAIPELVRRNLPATYFVSTEFIKTGRHFPHDVRVGQPLAPNTIEQLRQFAAQGIEIGSHTQNHVDLGEFSEDECIQQEIVDSRIELESWLDLQVRYFAFPFGLPNNTSQAAVNKILSAGYKGFCTAYGAWNWPGTAGLHLRRIHADPGIERLKNWLTYDTRKLRDDRALPFEEPLHGVGDELPALVQSK